MAPHICPPPPKSSRQSRQPRTFVRSYMCSIVCPLPFAPCLWGYVKPLDLSSLVPLPRVLGWDGVPCESNTCSPLPFPDLLVEHSFVERLFVPPLVLVRTSVRSLDSHKCFSNKSSQRLDRYSRQD